MLSCFLIQGFVLLPYVAQFVHVFDGGFEDESFCFAAYLERVVVVPLDAAFYMLTVFKHDYHWSLQLNLFLQVE